MFQNLLIRLLSITELTATRILFYSYLLTNFNYIVILVYLQYHFDLSEFRSDLFLLCSRSRTWRPQLVTVNTVIYKYILGSQLQITIVWGLRPSISPLSNDALEYLVILGQTTRHLNHRPSPFSYNYISISSIDMSSQESYCVCNMCRGKVLLSDRTRKYIWTGFLSYS